MLFDHLDLFRFSDFGLLLLFVLGALCVFAQVIFPRFVIPNSTENFKYVGLDPIIGLFLWARTCPRGVLQPVTGVALRGLERPDKEVYTTIEGMMNMNSRMLFVGEESPRGFSG